MYFTSLYFFYDLVYEVETLSVFSFYSLLVVQIYVSLQIRRFLTVAAKLYSCVYRFFKTSLFS